MAKLTSYFEPNSSNKTGRPTPLIKIKDDTGSKDKGFYLNYIEVDNGKEVPKVLSFVLPPAVEHALQYSPSGMLKGNVQTPQTKPGLPIKTQMKIVSMGVPGGVPIHQVSGVQGSVYEFVGALTGGEIIAATRVTADSKYIYRYNNKPETDPWRKESGTGDIALDAPHIGIKMTQIIQKGQQVRIDLVGDFRVSYTGVIAVFEQYLRWSNRVYYMIKMIGTRYGDDLLK